MSQLKKAYLLSRNKEGHNEVVSCLFDFSTNEARNSKKEVLFKADKANSITVQAPSLKSKK